MKVRCPNCHDAVELADETVLAGETSLADRTISESSPIDSSSDTFTDVKCPTCGDRFDLLYETETITFGNEGEPNVHVAHFELLEKLGTGGFGDVFRARDTKLDRIVAIKIPRADRLDSSGAEMFLREARAAAQLKHPNIVSVHEVGRDGETLYIVSDFIDGIPLSDWLTGQQPSTRQAVELLAIVAEALHHAHEAGVVHRDLKPSNIMLDSDQTPHVMDFGLAKRETGEVTMTVEGQVMGTPAYMSPEQAQGAAHLADRRTDVYSLGVILFELLTGERPFRGNIRMLLHQILQEEPPSPRKLNGSVPRDLETICLKCLEKDPQRRFTTAKALAEELRRYLSGEPILARPIGRSARVWRWCRRNRLVSSLLAAVAFSLIAGVIVSGLFAFEMKLQRDDANEQRSQKEFAESRELQAKLDADAERFQTTLAKKLSEERKRQFELQQSLTSNTNGRALCRSGFVAQGLLWFARALKELPSGNPKVDFEIRANLALWRSRMLSQRAFFSHSSSLNAAVFSRDGRAVLTGSMDRTARLWESATGKPLGPVLQHSHQVECATLAADGTTALTGCFDGTIRVWNAVTGKLVGKMMNAGDLVRNVALSRSGRLGVARTSGNEVFLLKGIGSSDPQIQKLDGLTKIASCDISPDGTSILIGSYEKFVEVWDTTTVKPSRKRLKLPKPLVHVAYSPNGERFVTAIEGIVVIWDTKTHQVVGNPTGHPGVRKFVFNRAGNLLTTFGSSLSSQIVSVRSGRFAGRSIEHRDDVSHASLSSQGGILATSSDKIGQLWDIRLGKWVGQPIRNTRRIVVAPGDSAVLTTGPKGSVRIWEYDTGGSATRRLPHRAILRDVAFSRDSDLVITADQSGVAQIWNVRTGEPVGEKIRHKSTIDAVAFSPTDNTAATASWDSTARLWNGETGDPIGDPLKHDQGLRTLAFTPNGGLLVTGGDDRRVRFWNASNGKTIGNPIVNPNMVLALAISPTGDFLVTSTMQGAAFRWKLPARRQVVPALQHAKDAVGRGTVDRFAISPDGRWIATGGSDKTIRLWNVKTAAMLHSPLAMTENVLALQFIQDGNVLVIGGRDDTVRRWDVKSGKLLGRSITLPNDLTSMAVSPDGRVVLTGSSDGTAQLWSLETGQPIGPPIEHRGEVSIANFSPDGKTFVTGHATAQLSSFAPLRGTPQQIQRWIEVITGMRLTADDAVELLDLDSWNRRRAELKTPGGTPQPRVVSPIYKLRSIKSEEGGPYGKAFLGSS